MKSSIRDTVEGTGLKTKGTIKQTVGKLSNNPGMEAAGTLDKIAGTVQIKTGEAKKFLNKNHESRIDT